MAQAPVAPEKWKRTYPTLDGTSPLGPFFVPDEKSSFVRMQIFELDEYTCHWVEQWIELKGHCVEVYEEQEAKEPILVFDLKETHSFLAAKGLPGSSPDVTSGRIALFSRYYMNKAVANNCFFFEFPTPQDGKAWLSSLAVNREWALRHSALMHPLGSCQVFGEMYEGKIVVRKRFSNSLMTKCAELHAVGLTEGKIEKLGGSRLEGRFQTREIVVRDGERLEYSADGGVKGDIVLAKASVVMVCNDVLTKSKARKKPKPSEAMEHVNWFGVIGEGDNRVFVFRTPEADVAERWCVSLAALSSVDKQKISQLIQLKVDQAKKNPARKVRYVGHPLTEPFYPVVPREDGGGGGGGKAASLQVPKAGAGDPRRKSDVQPSTMSTSTEKVRPVSMSPRGALPTKPGRNDNNEEEDFAPPSSSPRAGAAAAKSPVRGPVASASAGASVALGGAAAKASVKTAAKTGPRVAAPVAAEPAAPESSFQKLRRATVALKSAAEARGAVSSVKGGAEPPKKATGPSAKEMEDVQKAEMRRLAALERKKLREERERLKGDGDDSSGGGQGGGQGGEGGASAKEVEALKAQLEQEVERRAAAEASYEKLKEKLEADKATARELKQLAKDYRSKFDEASKEVQDLKDELEAAHARESELQDEHEHELAAARSQSVAAAAGEDNDEVVVQLQDEIASLSEQLSKAKGENRQQAKEVRELRAAIEGLEADKEKLMEENDLLLGEVAQAEEMQEAVEGILALGDPAELVAQLEELLVENEALTTEVAALKKKAGVKR